MKSLFQLAVLLSVFTGAALSLRAQTPAPPPMPADQPLSDAQLDQLLGPIALYPDPLIAEFLPAATFPAQIVLADRYIEGGGDPGQISQQPWDASVQAVARYPGVLKYLDDNLSETTELGEAFLNQQQAVMASIQRLRRAAFQLGNLQTTAQQQVTDDNGNIEIEPTDPQELYVPTYQPDQVYDDSANGQSYISYGTGYPMGDWLDDDFDWNDGDLIVWDPGYARPADWRHHHGNRQTTGTTVWHPGNRSSAAATYSADRGWDNAPAVTPARPTANAFVVPQTSANPIESERVARPAENGALIGVENSRETRSYSERGQQSMGAMTRPAPAAPATSGGRAPGAGFGGTSGGRR